jgi:hypothetical protein
VARVGQGPERAWASCAAKGFLAVGALGPVSRLTLTWKVRRGEAESPTGGWLHLAGFSRFHGGSRPAGLV